MKSMRRLFYFLLSIFALYTVVAFNPDKFVSFIKSSEIDLGTYKALKYYVVIPLFIISGLIFDSMSRMVRVSSDHQISVALCFSIITVIYIGAVAKSDNSQPVISNHVHMEFLPNLYVALLLFVVTPAIVLFRLDRAKRKT